MHFIQLGKLQQGNWLAAERAGAGPHRRNQRTHKRLPGELLLSQPAASASEGNSTKHFAGARDRFENRFSGLVRDNLPLANGARLPKLRAAAGFARLFVVFAFPQFFLNAASLKQFLEAAQGQSRSAPVRGRASSGACLLRHCGHHRTRIAKKKRTNLTPRTIPRAAVQHSLFLPHKRAVGKASCEKNRGAASVVIKEWTRLVVNLVCRTLACRQNPYNWSSSTTSRRNSRHATPDMRRPQFSSWPR